MTINIKEPKHLKFIENVEFIESDDIDLEFSVCASIQKKGNMKKGHCGETCLLIANVLARKVGA